MVIYESVVEGNPVDWIFMMDISGAQYVQMDLVMKLELLHVDNWDMEEPLMSILTASMLFKVTSYLKCNLKLHNNVLHIIWLY